MPDDVTADRVLVNHFYAHPVGHAVEALHYCVGHAAAAPGRRVEVALPTATATELATWCPEVAAVHAIDHPFLEPGPGDDTAFDGVPREWDWVLDDVRRHQPFQLEMFPGMADYYATSDRLLRARAGRSVVGAERVGYVRHTQLRLDLPADARESAAHLLGSARPRIALLPAGSSEPALYPSAASWELVLDALTDAVPDVQVVLVGKLGRDDRTSTSTRPQDVHRLLAHRSRPVACLDRPLAEQLAVVEACDAFLSPHTGFGMAALAVATPWLTISGGRWFEYFFNRVPFRSVVPDTSRFGAFTQFDPAQVVDDGDDGPRTPSMSRTRIRADLDRIVAGAVELIRGEVDYDDAVRDYVRDLVAAHGGDTSAIWSLDGVHADYL